MDKWWKYIYDLWLEEGDLKVLRYLQKIQRYLEKRRRTQQEVLNLTTQIEAILSKEYHGKYTYHRSQRIPVSDVLYIMDPTPTLKPSDLPNTKNLEKLAHFFENPENIRIKPQPTEDMFQHPCWILWSSLYNKATHHLLWPYRKQFIYYMEHEDYLGAAQVYRHAVALKERTEQLPLYDPEIIQHIMYSNLNYFAQKECA